MSGDEICLTLPADEAFHGVAHLVLGGLAVRLDLTYEDLELVRHGMGFEAVAALLWFRAGAEGARISHASEAFEVADRYGKGTRAGGGDASGD